MIRFFISDYRQMSSTQRYAVRVAPKNWELGGVLSSESLAFLDVELARGFPGGEYGELKIKNSK